MTDLIEVRVSNLVGAALDWAVAKAAELRMFEMGPDGNWPGNFAVTQATQVEPAIIRDLMGRLWFEASLRTVPWSPSTDWSQGGPLIEKYQVALVPEAHDGKEGTESSERWYADVYYKGGEQYTTEHCDTALIAACQAIVATEFGDTVQVPKELMP